MYTISARSVIVLVRSTSAHKNSDDEQYCSDPFLRPVRSSFATLIAFINVFVYIPEKIMIHLCAKIQSKNWGLYSIRRSLRSLLTSGRDRNLNLLQTQSRMHCRELHCPSGFFRPNPNCSRSANEGEGIVPDDFCRAIKFQPNCVVGKRLHGAEFVGDAEHDARRVCAIG